MTRTLQIFLKFKYYYLNTSYMLLNRFILLRVHSVDISYQGIAEKCIAIHQILFEWRTILVVIFATFSLITMCHFYFSLYKAFFCRFLAMFLFIYIYQIYFYMCQILFDENWTIIQEDITFFVTSVYHFVKSGVPAYTQAIGLRFSLHPLFRAPALLIVSTPLFSLVFSYL